MQCTKDDAMPVRLFNSIFFPIILYLSFLFVSSHQIENPSIIRVMLHQPASSPFDEITESMHVDLKMLNHIGNYFLDIYLKKMGKPVSVVVEALRRDSFMTATEARDYGIVDVVADEILSPS